jgi:hypothetical protein
MTRRPRRRCVASASAVVLMISSGPAGAADKAKLDDATHQVAQGAESLGYGEFGRGVTDLFIGLGRTIVEGTVYTGKSIVERFNGGSGQETEPPRTKIP